MIRKEEIQQAAYAPEHRHYTYADSDVMSFIEGAKWADKTMIEKACAWMEKNHNLIYGYEVIDEFKKAMEE